MQFHSQPTSGPGVAAPHPPGIRPRVRARRGQATDPHSIAERVKLANLFLKNCKVCNVRFHLCQESFYVVQQFVPH